MPILNEIFEQPISLMSNDDAWKNYETCLKIHDWTYEYSDDSRYWTIGSQERKYINLLKLKLSNIDKEKAENLYNKYCVK